MKTRLLTIMLVALAAVTVSCKKDGTDYPNPLPAFSPDAVIPANLAVDLGICNHLKWRSGNLGANYAQEWGDYYAWGQTDYYYQDGEAQKSQDVKWKEGKETGYTWDSYDKFSKDKGLSFIKYNSGDDFIELQPEDDAAAANLGDGWRMPTKEEWAALVENSSDEIDMEWTVLCGRYGWKFTSKVEGCEGNYIFLPAGGGRQDTQLHSISMNVKGYYWSSNYLITSAAIAWGMSFDKDKVNVKTSAHYRFCGFCIRPVCD